MAQLRVAAIRGSRGPPEAAGGTHRAFDGGGAPPDLEEALFPERRPGRSLLEVLQAGPFAEPGFEPERARDRGRSVEL